MSESLIVSLDDIRPKKKRKDDYIDSIMIYQAEAIDSEEAQKAFDQLSFKEQLNVANDYIEMTR